MNFTQAPETDSPSPWGSTEPRLRTTDLHIGTVRRKMNRVLRKRVRCASIVTSRKIYVLPHQGRRHMK